MNSKQLGLFINVTLWWAVEFEQFFFFRDELWNFLNWPTEFGRIFGGKPWALLMSLMCRSGVELSKADTPPRRHLTVQVVAGGWGSDRQVATSWVEHIIIISFISTCIIIIIVISLSTWQHCHQSVLVHHLIQWESSDGRALHLWQLWVGSHLLTYFSVTLNLNIYYLEFVLSGLTWSNGPVKQKQCVRVWVY